MGGGCFILIRRVVIDDTSLFILIWHLASLWSITRDGLSSATLQQGKNTHKTYVQVSITRVSVFQRNCPKKFDKRTLLENVNLHIVAGCCQCQGGWQGVVAWDRETLLICVQQGSFWKMSVFIVQCITGSLPLLSNWSLWSKSPKVIEIFVMYIDLPTMVSWVQKLRSWNQK